MVTPALANPPPVSKGFLPDLEKYLQVSLKRFMACIAEVVHPLPLDAPKTTVHFQYAKFDPNAFDDLHAANRGVRGAFLSPRVAGRAGDDFGRRRASYLSGARVRAFLVAAGEFLLDALDLLESAAPQQ